MRRGLDAGVVADVLARPEQRIRIGPSRDVVQSRRKMEGGRLYLVRVFVETDRQPAEVVTAYRTSKVLKYWQEMR